ncbi:MAG: hypothetical protein DMF86_24730 [Acidobacteria bacterium]|nr:MAG: hypothetical protein DMF86_24730 [Acidobacteriota bacterium]
MSVMTDDLLARLLDKVEHRFYGKYRGFVVDNADPQKRGRLRVTVPSVLGDVVSGWALPCAPYGGHAGRGFFFIPEKKDGVWVEFESGLLEFPVWVGTFFSQPGGTTEAPPPGNSQSPPTSKIIKTAKHTIELADADNSEAIIVTDSTNKNTITIDKNGVLIVDGNGNKVKLESGGVTIESSKIKVGAAAAEKLVKGDTLLQLLTQWHTKLSTHVHPNGNMGSPTGPAVTLAPPPTLNSMLSSAHVVE